MRDKELLDISIYAINLADFVLKTVNIFRMLDVPLNDHGVVCKLKIRLWRNHSVFYLEFFFGVKWFVNWDTDGLSFELAMTSIIERYLVHRFVLCSFINVDLAFLTKLFWPKHDSSG